jgi:hypothetical protein
MTNKEFVYLVHRRLQDDTGSVLQRAHVYELLAAVFGFKSYAALGAEAIFTSRRSIQEISTQSTMAIAIRCVELGYSHATAGAVSSSLATLVAEYRIDVARFDDLIAELRGELRITGDFSVDDEDGDEDDDDDDVGEGKQASGMRAVFDNDQEVSSILLSGLEAAAAKGNHRAHYVLALIYEADDDDDDDDEQVSPYWHAQGQQGRVLVGVEKEWADAYANRLAKSEKYTHHLGHAARLGNQHAQRDVDASSGANDSHWLTVDAEAGDTDAMRELIEVHDRDNLPSCWKWLYLARLLGIDLTESAHHLINEDGSEYDDDVGGPAHVTGYDGVELVALDEVQDVAARQAADELFRLIGRARWVGN